MRSTSSGDASTPAMTRAGSPGSNRAMTKTTVATPHKVGTPERTRRAMYVITGVGAGRSSRYAGGAYTVYKDSFGIAWAPVALAVVTIGKLCTHTKVHGASSQAGL